MSGAVNDGEDGGVIFKSRRPICRRWSAVVGTPATVWWAGLVALGTGRGGEGLRGLAGSAQCREGHVEE